jgi:hypothetical protein
MHARRSERLSGVITLIVRRFTTPKAVGCFAFRLMGEHRRKADGRRVFKTEFKRKTVQRIPSPVRRIRKHRSHPRWDEAWPGPATKLVGPLADKHLCGASRLIRNRAQPLSPGERISEGDARSERVDGSSKYFVA